MRRLRLFVVGMLAAIAASLLSASPATADVDDFSFDSLEVDYTLTRADDGTSRLEVVETFVARFPDSDQNRGMRRSIPAVYKGQPLNPTFASITDETGAERPAETDTEDDVFSMVSRADDFVHGAQTYVFRYTLEHVTWDFADTGLEFQWDVNGIAWEQPFGEITARLHLGPELADATTGDAACYAGRQGDKDSCDAIDLQSGADGAVYTARAADVQPHETLTMAVGFDDSTFVPFDASFTASPAGWAQAIGAIAMLAALGLAIRSRRTALRDEPGRATIVAEFTPPRGMDALESAVLLGRTTKAIPAEVLEQAIVGSIRIVEGGRAWGGGTKLVAELVDPALADGDGKMLLDGLFPQGRPGEQYEFGSTDTRLSSAAQKILGAADADLTGRGLRRSVPNGTRWIPAVIASLGLVAVIVSGILALVGRVDPLWPIALLVAAVVMFVAVVILIARRPLTAAGAEARDHLKGLQQFIEWAEADRIRMLQSPQGAERVAVDTDDPRLMLDLYEKLLPYAVVFGQEKQWSERLATLYGAVGVATPVWYYGAGAFDASSFSAGIGSLSSAAMSSSSSGGSTGGGSAGGGGGGGGGGGV